MDLVFLQSLHLGQDRVKTRHHLLIGQSRIGKHFLVFCQQRRIDLAGMPVLRQQIHKQHKNAHEQHDQQQYDQ